MLLNKRLIGNIILAILLWVSVLMFIDYLLFLIPGTVESFLNFSYQMKVTSKQTAFIQQFLLWLWNFLCGEWGTSMLYNTSVKKILIPAIINSFILSLMSFFLTLFYTLYLTFFALLTPRKWLVKILIFLLNISICLSPVVICLLVFLIGVYYFNLVSFLQFNLSEEQASPLLFLSQMILPSIAISIIQTPYLFRIFYPIAKKEWKKHHIKHLLAWNVPQFAIIKNHLLFKMFEPLCLNAGDILSSFLVGSFIVEMIFSWPGISKILFEASLAQDRLIVLAFFAITTLTLILGNLIGKTLIYRTSIYKKEDNNK